jgi:hypothetical protein
MRYSVIPRSWDSSLNRAVMRDYGLTVADLDNGVEQPNAPSQPAEVEHKDETTGNTRMGLERAPHLSPFSGLTGLAAANFGATNRLANLILQLYIAKSQLFTTTVH